MQNNDGYSDEFNYWVYITTAVISGISFFPYIALLIVYFKTRASLDLISIINIQLIISSILHSSSFLIPPEKGNALCIFQSVLNSVSDINTDTISLSIALISLLNFAYPKLIEDKKCIFHVIIGIFCWVFPITCGVTPAITNSIVLDFNNFCWISPGLLVYIVYGIMMISYFVNLWALLMLRKKIKDFLKEENFITLYSKFYKRIIRYIILLILNILLTILNVILLVFEDKIEPKTGQILYCFESIIESSLCPIYAIVYGFNKERMEVLKNVLCCRKDNNIVLIKKAINDNNESDVSGSISLQLGGNSICMMDALGFT